MESFSYVCVLSVYVSFVHDFACGVIRFDFTEPILMHKCLFLVASLAS